MRNIRRFRATRDGCLDSEMQEAFSIDGVLVLEDFATPECCEALVMHAEKLVSEFEPGSELTLFSSTDQSHKAQAYFQTSGDKIRFFFEPDAFDAQGRLQRPKAQAINKIGHALHDLDPDFHAFSRQPQLARIAASLQLTDPLLLQSMYIFKQPFVGGAVVCHQDSTFLYTEPLSCVGFWFALHDATLENGCLHAIPGRYPLRQRFRYRGSQLAMQSLDEREWPLEQAIPLEVPQGTLVVLDGLLPHFSHANRSARPRHAYTLHLIDGTCHYPSDNWLRRSSNKPLTGFINR